MERVNFVDESRKEGFIVQLPFWYEEEYVLVSLMELMKYNEALFRSFGAVYGIAIMLRAVVWEGMGADPRFTDGMLEALKKTIFLVRAEPSVNSLPMIALQVNRVAASLENANTAHSKVLSDLEELYGRIEDSMSSQLLFIMPPARVENYQEPLKYWREAATQFPRALDAMEEAEKCYALGRNTASVFHCMAIMQEGLDSLAKHLKIKVDPFSTWEGIIKDIDNAIEAKRTSMRTPQWKSVEAFYGESLSDLRSVKNAWRNPTMHFRRTYDEWQAAKVRDRVRDFMLHLGTKLKGRPPRKLLGA